MKFGVKGVHEKLCGDLNFGPCGNNITFILLENQIEVNKFYRKKGLRVPIDAIRNNYNYIKLKYLK
jgi:hypothetical protein